MKNKFQKGVKMEVVPLGTGIRHNTEDGQLGEGCVMTNMRECNKSLEVVGEGREVTILPAGEKLLFVHRMNDRNNWLTINGNNVILRGYIASGETKFVDDGRTVGIAEGDVNAINAVGDVVILETTKGRQYLVYSDNMYAPLNIEDAIPQILFSTQDVTTLSASVLGGTLSGNYTNWNGSITTDDRLTLQCRVAAAYKSLRDEWIGSGYYSNPVSVRCGVRLWDDSYLWLSSPRLLGKGVQGGDSVSAVVNADLQSYNDSKISVGIYRPGISVLKAPSAQWSRFIKSVDILVSEEMEPFVEPFSIDCQSLISQSGNRTYYLNYRLKRKSNAVANGGVLNPRGWKLLASITDLESLQQGEVNGVNIRKPVILSDMPSSLNTYSVIRTDMYATEVVRADVRQTVRNTNHKAVSQCGISHNGRYYSAGQKRELHNMWSACEWFGNSGLIKEGCKVMTTVKLKTGVGVATKVYMEEMDYTPNCIAPLVAYPDSRAISIEIRTLDDSGNIKVWCSELVPNEDQGCAYSLQSDYNERNMDIGYSFYRLTELNTTEHYDDMLTISAAGNPFVVSEERNVGQGVITNLAVVAKGIYSNTFGRYPIYAFTTTGIYAIAYKASGDYKDAQLIDHRTIKSGSNIASANDHIYFVSGTGELCSLCGKTLRVVREDCNARQLAWNQKYNELMMLNEAGRWEIMMQSERSYYRDIDITTLYSNFYDVLAVGTGGTIYDMTTETESIVNIACKSFLMHLPNGNKFVPYRMQLNATIPNGYIRFSLIGCDSVDDAPKVLHNFMIFNTAYKPEPYRIYSRGVRLLYFVFGGMARPGALIRNVEIEYSVGGWY